MAIQLGKDCAISVDGVTLLSARVVNVQRTARTIDVNEYGSRQVTSYPTGYETTVTVEVNDIDHADAAKPGIIDGLKFDLVSAGGSGLVMPCIVTSMSETQPVDGVVTYTIEARLTRFGINKNDR